MNAQARLKEAQEDLLRTLLRPTDAWAGHPPPAGLQAQAGIEGGVARGVQAYRLNSQVLADKVLAQTFPRLRAGLGEDSFAAMAASFWRQHPPARGDLGEWGQVLPEFLAERGVEAWWVDLARLEWAAHGLERARDDVFDAASLRLLSAAPPADFTLCLRAGSHVLSVHAGAWQRWQAPLWSDPSEEDEADQLSIWLWRPQWKAELMQLPAAEAAFMSALLQGRSLEAALQDAELGTAGAEPLDFAAWLQKALQLGWLVAARSLISG